MKQLFLFILMALFINLKAENIYMKNGTILINVKIIEKDERGWIHYQMSNGKTSKINESAILKIENVPFNPELNSQIRKNNSFKTIQNKNEVQNNHYTTDFPHLKFFPISIIAFVLSYDYFKDVKNLNDQIDQYEKLDLETGYLKKMRNRKQTSAYFFLLAGIANTIITFKPVKVYANQNQIGLAINF